MEGATQIFIYTTNSDFIFANTTAALERLRLNIFGARIFTSANGYCLDTFTVLENTGRPIGRNPKRLAEVKSVLVASLTAGNKPLQPARFRRTRKEKYFGQRVEANLINTADKNYSTLEVNCPDQPGILACVGKIFVDNGVHLKDARITTLGERVEDLFFVTDARGQAITDTTAVDTLLDEIKSQLEARLAA